MFKPIELAVLVACAIGACGIAWSAERTAQTATPAFTGVGRAATPAEIRAWDVDVRADFKGLPKGSGTVAHGQEIWEGRCASCHGTFGESNEVFAPIIGGTTKDDIVTGHVAALTNNSAPQRTTMMKLSAVSTLWDYIRRAMPWNAPKSLSTDEVYAVVAYILNMADVLPNDFTLSDQNIGQAQARLPNRNGMTRDHGLWEVRGKPDVKSVACMKDCPVADKIASALPEAARGANGNPADQTRAFGETHAIDLASSGKAITASPPAARPAKSDAHALATSSGCVACHAANTKIVGPAFKSVAEKYKDDAKAADRLAEKIIKGSVGVWGLVPMPPASGVTPADAKILATWVLAGAPAN
ncbi:MAG: c-type cytochrome [Burkholderiaceae bacterium]